MRKTILLKSRYGETHRLERVGGSTSCLFLFVPADGYYRLGLSGKEEDGYDFVDPSGGPFISVGTKFESLNKTVKSIKRNEDNQIVIEFE